MEFKNTGLDIEREQVEQTSEDWVFGGTYSDELILEFDPEKYLPDGESQALGEDKMDCVTRAYINKIETVLLYLYLNNRLNPNNKEWLEKNGYIQFKNDNPKVILSNKFNAIKSNTTKRGNSMKAPADSIYRDGVIPRVMLAEDKPETWDEYHNKAQITDEMIKMGQEFKKRFPINYERVTQSKWKNLPIGCAVAVFAWPNPVNGIYPRVEGAYGHCVYEFKPEWFIYDNYPDWRVDGDWIKQLAPNYNFYTYGYRLIFHENPYYEAPADGETYDKEFKKGDPLTWLEMWFAIFKKALAGLGKKIGNIFKN